MNPISRKAALVVGSLVTAGTVAAGAGVATAATTSTKTPAAKAQTRIERVEKRQTRNAHRLDAVAKRLTTRDGKLTTKVSALTDGSAKTDAQAKLADLGTKVGAAKAADAKVLAATAGIDPTDTTAATATLKADRALLKTSRADLRAARQDVRAIVATWRSSLQPPSTKARTARLSAAESARTARVLHSPRSSSRTRALTEGTAAWATHSGASRPGPAAPARPPGRRRPRRRH